MTVIRIISAGVLLACVQVSQAGEAPAKKVVRKIDFEKAQVVPGLLKNTYVLIVAGTKPYQAMKVKLTPLVYIQQPDYWGLELVGVLPDGPVAAVTGPFQVVLSIDGKMGKLGIEVIGKSKKKKFDLPLRKR